MKHTIKVTLATRDESDMVTFARVGEYPTRRAAMAAAKSAAGRGTTFARYGVNMAYNGPNGRAWLDE